MTTPGTPFGAVLERLAAEAADRPAITCADRTLTRGELLDGVRRLATAMAVRGVGEGSVVTIGLPNSVGFVQAALATWWLGGTPQPVSHRLPTAERRAIVELADSALSVGLAQDDVPGRAVMSAEELERAATSSAPVEHGPRVSSTWKAVTSGGSTGRPKLIVADAPALAESVLPLAELLRIPREGTVLVTGPLSHNAPLVASLACLLSGGHVVVMPRFEAVEALRLVQDHRVQWFYLVPTMMQRIWRLPEEQRTSFDLSSVEVAFHMAAPCPPWLKKEWIDWLGQDRLLELYGGTELQAMTVVTGKEWLEHPGSVGRPVLGEIECRDGAGNRLGPHQTGELWMRRGEGLPRPYRYVGATARSDDDGWDCLGDIGHLDEDGYVYITDRDSDMILVGGANVYPAEIEAALDEHPLVRSSCVVGLPHEDLGSAPHAIVETAAEVADEELLAHLRDRLAPYKLPRTFERSSEPLRDDAGKVRRAALREARLP